MSAPNYHPHSFPRLSFSPLGDSAVLVAPVTNEPKEAWTIAHAVARAVSEPPVTGIEGVVATYATTMIEFDPLSIDPLHVQALIYERLGDIRVEYLSGRTARIPVVYGHEFGPDLERVADILGMSTDSVIEAHSSVRWRVAFNGAPAGAPMHEAAAFHHPIPRLDSPRTHIPAGSVAVSGAQGIIYTLDSPGGWQLLGRTPVDIVNMSARPFSALRPGDQLIFEPMTPAEYRSFEPRFVGDLIQPVD